MYTIKQQFIIFNKYNFFCVLVKFSQISIFYIVIVLDPIHSSIHSKKMVNQLNL